MTIRTRVSHCGAGVPARVRPAKAGPPARFERNESSFMQDGTLAKPSQSRPLGTFGKDVATVDLQDLVGERRVRVGDGARQYNGPDQFGHQLDGPALFGVLE